MGILLFVLPCILFSFSPDFSSKISPQPLKIETLNLVYRFTTTSCIMGLQMASFLDLNFSISDRFVQTIIYDKRDDFEFDIVNVPFLDGDVPRSTSYGVYISQLIRFARVSSHVDDFNTRN